MKLKTFLNVLLRIGPWFLIAFFWCVISPAEAYTWYDGIWQGAYVVPNWIISFFQDGRLCKAVEFNVSYNIFWWIFTILTSIYSFFIALGLVMLMLGKNPNQVK